MDLRFVGRGPEFGPARRHIGEGQGAGKIPLIGAPLVLHQVDFAKTGALVIPIGEGPHRNLLFEQGARFGAPAQPAAGTAGGPAPAIHGGRTDL